MSLRQYLPTGRFSSVVFSLIFASGMVYAASTMRAPTTTLATSTNTEALVAQERANWEATLAQIQDQSGVTSPTPPSEQVVAGMRKAAQSSNVTDSVARTLLVNLTNAKAQGLGSDIPTQNQLVAEAVSQIQQNQRTTAYTKADLVVVADSKDAQRAYGNALATIFTANKTSEYADTLILIDQATSQNDASQLKKLPPIKKYYGDLTVRLLKMPVPQTLSPFHLQLVNDFERITQSYDSMQNLLSDPLQGLSGLQTYRSTTQETFKVFINIAQALSKGGILFNKDDPGAAWASLLSLQ